MHELSLACSVLELVGSEMQRHGAGTLRSVEVTVGELSGVDSDAFAFSLQMVLDRSAYAGARVTLTRVSPRSLCTDLVLYALSAVRQPCHATGGGTGVSALVADGRDR